MLPSVLGSLDWIARALSGGVFAAIAVLMLAGQVPLRRAGQVLLGIGIVAGSRALALGLLGAASGGDGAPAVSAEVAVVAPPAAHASPDSSPAPQDELAMAYAAVREAAQVRFPGAQGIPRFNARLAPDGTIAHFDARGEGFDPAAVAAAAQVMGAATRQVLADLAVLAVFVGTLARAEIATRPVSKRSTASRLRPIPPKVRKPLYRFLEKMAPRGRRRREL